MGLLLLGLALAALVLTGPVALVVVLLQRSQIERLRRDLAALSSTGHTPEAPVATPQRPSLRPAASTPTPTKAISPSHPEHAPGHLENVIGGQWLTWIGILAIFFGTAFFLAYDLGESAFAGVGQILIALLVATAFGIAGTLLTRRTQRFLGQGLLGGSTALLFLTAYAAYGFHRLIPAATVYPFLAAVTLIGAWIATSTNSLSIATLTLVGAIVTPHLLDVGGDPSWVLFPYLVAVTLGAAIMGIRRSWPLIPLLAFVAATVTILTWWTQHFDPHRRLSVSLTVLTLWVLHLILPLVRTRGAGAWRVAYSAIVLVNAAAVTTFCYRILAPNFTELRGLVTVAIGVVYLGVARLAEAPATRPATFVTYYTGIALAVVAVPIHFDAAWTTLVWALFGYILLETGIRFPRIGHRVAGWAVLVLTGFRLILEGGKIATRGGDPYPVVFNADFAIGVVVVAAFVAAAFRIRSNRDHLTASESLLFTPLLVTAFALLWWHVSFETIAYFHTRTGFRDDASTRPAVLALSWIWAVYAGALITGGFLARFRPIRFLGVLVLGVLVLKVFLLDMQYLERGYRIASFVGVGMLLLIISLLYQRERKP